MLTISISVSAQTPNHPFPNHTIYAAGHIKPNNYSQTQLDAHTSSFYNQWKEEYLSNNCGANLYYVDFGDNYMTVSEAHGYGMMITAFMAGHDSDAKTYFDGMCNYYDQHRSSINDKLMSWQQSSCSTPNYNDDAATDGDIDIAFALLLADKQWGSTGNINYFSKAVDIINAIMEDEINQTHWHVKLGDWANSTHDGTRTSDFITDHFRSFKAATNNNNWDNVIDKCYDLIDDMQTNYSATTGLLPDFIINIDATPEPAGSYYLEGTHDGHYYYNACRDPWRLTSDFLIYNEIRAKNSVNKITNWLKTDCNNSVYNISNGYELDGTAIYTWADPAFIAPFAVGAMVNLSHQNWLNALYENVKSTSINSADYYENSIKMMSMIVLSGNYWTYDYNIANIYKNNTLKEKIFTVNNIRNNLYLKFNSKYFSNQKSISIIDVSGKIIYFKIINNKEECKINISELNTGVYIITVYLSEKNVWFSEKIIIT